MRQKSVCGTNYPSSVVVRLEVCVLIVVRVIEIEPWWFAVRKVCVRAPLDPHTEIKPTPLHTIVILFDGTEGFFT